MPTVLQDADGDDAVLQEGESANLVVVFKDMSGTQIPKAAIISLVCTYYDRYSKVVINGRNEQNVLDANGGTVASDGTLTLRLGPLDTVIIGAISPGQSQTKCFLFEWEFDDGVLERTGKCGPLTVRIENLVEAE